MNGLTSVAKPLLEIMIILYLLSAILFLYRVIRGPRVFDRLLAIDSLSYDLAVFMAMISLYTSRHILAVCMIPIALWAYTLDIYISWYATRGIKND
ncbi:MAG: monovalent cation/H+ antiporter complex subunit F [Desulfurococcaceae archaeon]